MRTRALFGFLIMVTAVGLAAPSIAGTKVQCDNNELHNISCHCRNQAGTIAGLYSAGRPVAHLIVTDANGDQFEGTGFLVGNDNHLITNNHVIPTNVEMASLKAIFSDELDSYGTARATTTYTADALVWTNVDLDYTIVHLIGNPQATFGSLPIARRDLILGEELRIIQHPLGETKQVSVTSCAVDDPFVLNAGIPSFLTHCDTEHGSSGSPILDSNLEVVGLHWGSVAGACPNSATRIEDLLNDAYSHAFVDLETDVARPDCPVDQVPSSSGCSCNKNNNDPPDCNILEPARLAQGPASPSSSSNNPQPPTLATLSVPSDVRATGVHTATLTNVTADGRTGDITGPFGLATLNAQSLTINASMTLQRVRPSIRGSAPLGEVHLLLRTLNGTASAMIPIPGSPSWGLSTGTNTLSLDSTVIGRVVCAGTSGVVTMSGSCGLRLRDVYFSAANPARLFVRFTGYYDFDTRVMTIKGLSLRTPMRTGIISVSAPALGVYATLVLMLVLAFFAMQSLRRRQSDSLLP